MPEVHPDPRDWRPAYREFRCHSGAEASALYELALAFGYDPAIEGQGGNYCVTCVCEAWRWRQMLAECAAA